VVAYSANDAGIGSSAGPRGSRGYRGCKPAARGIGIVGGVRLVVERRRTLSVVGGRLPIGVLGSHPTPPLKTTASTAAQAFSAQCPMTLVKRHPCISNFSNHAGVPHPQPPNIHICRHLPRLLGSTRSPSCIVANHRCVKQRNSGAGCCSAALGTRLHCAAVRSRPSSTSLQLVNSPVRPMRTAALDRNLLSRRRNGFRLATSPP
jgi:hypothetical protein